MPVQLWEAQKEDLEQDLKEYFMHTALGREVAESRAFWDIVERVTDLGKEYTLSGPGTSLA
jgi:hypothetical protein